MAIYGLTPGFKGRTFKLCVLTRWDFNFCVRSSPLRGKERDERKESTNNTERDERKERTNNKERDERKEQTNNKERDERKDSVS